MFPGPQVVLGKNVDCNFRQRSPTVSPSIRRLMHYRLALALGALFRQRGP
jgi:hypothetical protein